MRQHTLLVALAAALALAACSMPPYNEQLSLAQVTRSKLGEPVNRIGPVYANMDPSAQENQFYFLPTRDDPENSGGFLAATSSYGLRVWYLADYSAGLESSWSIDLDNDSDTTFNYLLEAIESSMAGYYFLSLTRNLPNDLRTIAAMSPASVNQYSAVISLSSAPLVAGMDTVGASVFPDSTTGSDPLYFLGYGGGTSSYYECAGRTDISGFASIVNGPGTILGGLVPMGLSSAFYCHDALHDKSYLSYPAGSGHISCSWTWDADNAATAASGFQLLSGIGGRIGAVLTNGRLLSFENGRCTVYSDVGKKLYDFPLGSLKFCYERWNPVDGRFELYFSLAYWVWGRDEKSDQLYVEVYAIPTDKLSSLK
jgi:hypothetical protein